MRQKNLHLTIYVVAFIVGAFFVFSNGADINADVIGASGSTGSLTAWLGIALLVVSSVLFMAKVSLDEHLKKTEKEAHANPTDYPASRYVIENLKKEYKKEEKK